MANTEGERLNEETKKTETPQNADTSGDVANESQRQAPPVGEREERRNQAKQKPGKPASHPEYDPFVLEDIFPDLTKLLVVPPATSEIVKDCIFVVDASALLAPYKISEESLKELSGIYRRLSAENRLFVAARALREFVKHRADKVKDAHFALGQMMQKVQVIQPLNLFPIEGTREYQDLAELRAQTNEGITAYRKKLSAIVEVLRNWNRNDDVSRLYAEVFTTDRICDHDVPREELLKDLKWRVVHEIPPGFHDSDKPDGGIGDLHIWHTILKAGKDKNRNVIFVSNDEKNDWMVRVNKEALFVREELVDEFHVFSGHHLSALNLRRFLKAFDASDKTLNEVESAERIPLFFGTWDRSMSIPKELLYLDQIIVKFLSDVQTERRDVYFIRAEDFDSVTSNFLFRWEFESALGTEHEDDRDYLTKIAIALQRIVDLNKTIQRMQASGQFVSHVEQDDLIDLCTNYMNLRRRPR